MTSIYIDFAVRSKQTNINLDDILGVKGNAHKIGDFSVTQIKLDYSEWSFNTSKWQTEYIEVALQNFISSIMPKLEKMIKILKQYDCECSIGFVVDKELNDTVYVDLSKESIKFCADIGSSIFFNGANDFKDTY